MQSRFSFGCLAIDSLNAFSNCGQLGQQRRIRFFNHAVSINLPHLRHFISPINLPLNNKALQQGQRKSGRDNTLSTCVMQAFCASLGSFCACNGYRLQFVAQRLIFLAFSLSLSLLHELAKVHVGPAISAAIAVRYRAGSAVGVRFQVQQGKESGSWATHTAKRLGRFHVSSIVLACRGPWWPIPLYVPA